MTRILIQGGHVVLPGRVAEATIVIEGERIAGIVEPNVDITADVTIDASNRIVLPGAIDAHTHFIQDDPAVAEPNLEEYEGFVNGGRAAAAGGVTTVVEMPQASPPTTNGATFRRRRELASEEALVDFALWGGVCSGAI